MNLLLDLTVRGTVATAGVLLLETAFRRVMAARWRRIWWSVVPLAYLCPLRLPLLPGRAASAASSTDRAPPSLITRIATSTMVAPTSAAFLATDRARARWSVAGCGSRVVTVASTHDFSAVREAGRAW